MSFPWAEHYTPKNPFMRWMDERLPLPRLVYDSFVAYPVPRNLNYAYTFGGILTLMLADAQEALRELRLAARRHQGSVGECLT